MIKLYIGAIKLTQIPKMPANELTPREAILLQLLREWDEYIQLVKDENAYLKGEKDKFNLEGNINDLIL